MERGCTTPSTDMSGYPMQDPGLLLMRLTVIGYSQIWDGHGFLIIHGDGRLFTMVAGTSILFTDQCGFPITNGARVGSPGEDQQIITAGHQ